MELSWAYFTSRQPFRSASLSPPSVVNILGHWFSRREQEINRSYRSFPLLSKAGSALTPDWLMNSAWNFNDRDSIFCWGCFFQSFTVLTESFFLMCNWISLYFKCVLLPVLCTLEAQNMPFTYLKTVPFQVSLLLDLTNSAPSLIPRQKKS